ncbi:MAG TPA: DinB family protein [Bryobacteraceae bacterium]|nr:DinB family protein [Bryobacteraceae bacterium]
MEKADRDQLLLYLAESRELLLHAVDNLTAEQRSFRPAEDRWSAAECVEHITVVENFTLQRIQTILQEPEQPHQPAGALSKDQLILDAVPVRATRVKGPPPVMPAGRWPDFEELLRQFEAARERTLRFAAVTQADLRSRAFPHPFLGPLDCYQWLLFLAAHCERHVRQIEEVKSGAAFPRERSATA